jgi:hypothetical protein
MAIKDDQEFEGRLLQLMRMYQAMRETWAKTNAANESEVQKWVIAGRLIVEQITVLLADIEDYSGTGELRLILNAFKDIKRVREDKVEKT